MRTILPFLVTVLIIISCADQPGNINKDPGTKQQKVNKVTKPPSSFTDTLVIKVSAAVFFRPDSLQLLKLKAITSSKDFESETHNWYYQVRNARMVIGKNWPQVHIMETFRARYLLFIKKDQQKAMIDLDKQGDMCGIFLFDGKKDPELVDMMNIDSFLGFYFQN